MRVSDLDFDLPQSLIPKYPLLDRDNDRLMVVNRASGTIEHKLFKDFISYMHEGDCLVVNDSKVYPWFLNASKDKIESKIEVTLLRELSPQLNMWDAKVEPARKIRVGNKLYFGDNSIVAEVLDNTTSRGRTLKFSFTGTNEELYNIIDSIGYIPIPSIIGRSPEDSDREDYKTIFAKEGGGIVAPASGLHFTMSTMKRLELQDVFFAPITVHISIGILDTITLEDVSKYKMDAEKVIISDESAAIINASAANKKKVCVVGTSVLRALESSASVSYKVTKINDWRSDFIYSNQQIAISNMLLTNFHLPKTIPLINTVAFMGSAELFAEAYNSAIKEEYRFFAYGDAMLII